MRLDDKTNTGGGEDLQIGDDAAPLSFRAKAFLLMLPSRRHYRWTRVSLREQQVAEELLAAGIAERLEGAPRLYVRVTEAGDQLTSRLVREGF